MIAKAGDIIEKEEIQSQIGTTIIVEDLFFNTPVRYKFLKQDSTEFRYIKELIEKMALANLGVSFRLINNGKEIFKSTGNGKIKDIIYILYGKDISDNLVEVNFAEGEMKVTGVIGNTQIARDNRKSQIFFLNKRNIRNQILTSSSDQAFKGSIGIGKYGFCILNLEMPANYYDINVHPTKMEVRFCDEDKIYKTVYHAIKSTMLDKEFLGNNEKELNKEKYVENEYNFLTNHFISNKTSVIKKDVPLVAKALNSNIKQISNINLNENKSKNNIYNLNNTDSNNENMNFETDNETIINNDYENEEIINRKISRHINYKYIGILMRTYIIIEIENELYLIDQHAAHERILYENIKDNYKKHIKNDSQMMLIPEVINLTHKEMQFVLDNLELIKNYGFDIEPFGENSVKINGVPDIEYREKTQNVFLEVLDEMLTNERSATKDIEERFIATVACKAAVKANMDLLPQEVDKLIRKTFKFKKSIYMPTWKAYNYKTWKK